MDTFYVTTPIYYVNDKPHIGSAYTTVLADVLAGYHRLLGAESYFITGTDEHGLKVQQAAEARGKTSQEHVDETVKHFQAAWQKLNIANDDFIRTTEKRHTEVVQEILQDLYDRDEIYKADYDGWYDVSSETFVTAKELEERGGPDANPNITQITESNYFFKMSAYKDWLVEYIEAHPEFIQPDFRRNETLGFLKRTLTDLCISRPKERLQWGIELPFDKDYVTYVWFDALINYISTIGYRRDDEKFNKWWPGVHLIGKDILTTHTVYWPTMLKAIGAPLPKTIYVHGWWMSDGQKMSKSLGNVIDPNEMVDEYGVDTFRYYLIAGMNPGQDGNFTKELFIQRTNTDLANDLGNLLSRITRLIQGKCDGKIPDPGVNALDNTAEQEVWAAVQKAVEEVKEQVAAFRLDRAIESVLTAIRSANKYIEIRKPWEQAKQEDLQPLQTTLYTAAEVLRVVSVLLDPVMPTKMKELRGVLGLGDERPGYETLGTWGGLEPGTPLGKAATLFPRIQTKKKKESVKPAAPKKKEVVEESDGLITYDQFSKTELRTAKVLNAAPVEGADKLLRLEVLIESERRQLVAGIAGHYSPEELIGKTVIVVANLKPAKIRGIESQGMILAASKGERLKLVTIDGDLASGATVK